MTSTEASFDYDAARKRLRAVTSDSAMLASFERAAASDVDAVWPGEPGEAVWQCG